MNADAPPGTKFLFHLKNPDVSPEATRLALDLLRKLRGIGAEEDETQSDYEVVRQRLAAEEFLFLDRGESDDERKFVDLAPIEDLVGLRGLYLGGNRIESIGVLERLCNLETLELEGNRIKNLRPACAMPKLKKLTLAWNPIKDLSMLSDLLCLEELEISCNQLDALGECGSLMALRVLRIFGGIADLRKVPPCPALRRLVLDRCDSFSGIERFEELREVGIDPGILESLAPLSGLEKLTSLFCSRNKITSLEPLRGHPSLRAVWVSQNNIASVEPLLHIPKLRASSVAGNPMSEAETQRLEESSLSWDAEFALPTSRPESESLKISELDSSAWFEEVSGERRGSFDGDEQFLRYEAQWIERLLIERLARHWDSGFDFCVQGRAWGSEVSVSVELESNKAVEALADLVRVVQGALQSCRRDYHVRITHDWGNRGHPEFGFYVSRRDILLCDEQQDYVRKQLGLTN